jgi:hypothetical protein
MAKELAMSTSEARIFANQEKSLKSTGPKTAEGKERSWRNGLKHGMTRQGIVIHAEDAAELERPNEAFQVEMAPKMEMALPLPPFGKNPTNPMQDYRLPALTRSTGRFVGPTARRPSTGPRERRPHRPDEVLDLGARNH